MRKVLFCILALATLNVYAWTEIPSQHLVCEKWPGTFDDKDCRLVPGPAPDLGFKLEPSDRKEVMSITRDITGRMTIERRDGSRETFRPDGMGGWHGRMAERMSYKYFPLCPIKATYERLC